MVVEEIVAAGRDDLTDARRALRGAAQPGGHRHRHRGARLKEVGSRARRQIEALLGTRVYLDLRVKIAKDWQRNPKQLRRLGFYD